MTHPRPRSWILSLALLGALPVRATEPLRILLVGDSIVARYPGAESRRIVGWGVALGELLKDDQVSYQNKAVGGTTTRTFYDRYWKPRRLPETVRPEILFIEFGHNDSYPDDLVSPRDFRKLLETYAREARAVDPEVDLVPVIPPLRYEYASPGRPYERDLKPYAEILRELGEEWGAPSVDLYAKSRAMLVEESVERLKTLYSLFEVRPGQPDTTHFSRVGAEHWASEIRTSLCAAGTSLRHFARLKSAWKESCPE